MKKAVLYQKLPGKKVRCQACSWYCHLAPGQLGVCATRVNKNGELYSLVYGRPTGLALDPVEKKPLFHFLPGSTALSFGTLGCNFGCLFCQNAWASQANKGQNLAETEKIINRLSVKITPRKIVAEALRLGARSLAYTYNEPAIFVEMAHDTAKIAKKHGLKNVFVSNGFESAETINYLRGLLDAINIDLKSFNEDFYRKICRAKIAPVKENIKKFFDLGVETEVTTLVIPTQNDSPQELAQIAGFLAGISKDIPWHVTAFYPAYQMMDTPPTPPNTLIRAQEIGKKAGLKYVYGDSTFCPRCGQILISRRGYDVKIEKINLNSGRCQNCQEKIYGVWK